MTNSSRHRRKIVSLLICSTAILAVIIVTLHRSDTAPNTPSPETGMSLFDYESMRLRDPNTGTIPDGIERRQLEFVKTIPTAESVRLSKPDAAGGTGFAWRSRGPYNIGGRVRQFGLDIRDENIIIAGGASGGIWKSTDNGVTWRKITPPDELHDVSCLVQDRRPGREDTWYYGTGERRGGRDLARGSVLYRGDGIYKSVDNGETWALLESTTVENAAITDYAFTWVWRIAIDVSNLAEDEVYAATDGVIYKSLDGGQSWTRVLGGLNRTDDFADVMVTSEGVVYATLSRGIDQGIYRSEDGDVWTEITPPDWPAVFHRIVMSVAPSNEDVVYFFTETTESASQAFSGPSFDPSFFISKYTYLSGDGSEAGGTWQNRSNGLPKVFSGMGYAIAIQVFPEDENKYLIGMQELFRYGRPPRSDAKLYQTIGTLEDSFDEEKGFHCDVHWIEFSPNDPKKAYVSHDGGLSKTLDVTADPVVWETCELGLITSQVYTTAIVPDAPGDPRILGCLHDNGVHHLDGFESTRHWRYMMGGDGAYAAFLDGGNQFIVSWQKGNTYIGHRFPESWDDYQCWTRINPVIASPLFINPFVVDPSDDRILYMAAGTDLRICRDVYAIPQDGTYDTKDEHWQTLSSVYTHVSAIGVSDDPPHIVYFGTVDGHLYRLNNVLGTPVRTVLRPTGDLRNGYISNIAVDPHDVDHVVLTFSNFGVRSLFATWDGGDTWSDVSGNLEEFASGQGNGPAVNWAAILPQGGSNTYFVGTSAGLYSTNRLDGLQTVWAREGATTIGSVSVRHVVTRETDGEVVVSTYGNGVYSRDLSSTAVSAPETVPERFTLSQNYPNPFNASTTIAFTLPRTSGVRLTILNTQGRIVKTLFSGVAVAGQHALVWDGTDDSYNSVGSGLYICTLKIGDAIHTRTMSFIK